ncbi:oxidoreductase [Sandarakinorhabdus sp. DWP1-3-1]|uniref:oxidoreductase n=1 Tax=Sandarakinorhabdus sp. DWP1-3-1 TaxID=2804627 RepID=UPI003CF6D2A6
MTDAPALFRPLTIRGVTFGNRVMLSPMCQYRAIDGTATRWHRSHHGRIALAGVGGALLEATAVLREGRITPGCLGIWSDEHLPGLAELAAIYHDEGIPVGIQLAHAGRKASSATPFDGARPLAAGDPRGWTSVAPSAIPFGPDWQVPAALDESGIAAIIDAFAAAGQRADAAGFDFVEIHGAHGYLVNSFVSPVSNRRSDGWGGDNRFRFAVAIAERLRAELPETMPIFYRVSAVDGVEGGITMDDTVALAKALKAAGVDVIDCSSGGVSGPSGVAATPPAPGYLVPNAERVRREAAIASMAVGLIMTAELADAIIAEGRADLVAIGRELLADSSFVHRAALALGLPHPHRVLPEGLSFYIERRRYEGMTR